MSCPKCGYSGHNTVSHWGTGEVECENCRHDYVPVKKSKEKSSGLPLPSARIATSDKVHKNLSDYGDIGFAVTNDVYITGEFNEVSVGMRPIGGISVGKVSGAPFDNLVRGHNGGIQGKITASGHFINQGI